MNSYVHTTVKPTTVKPQYYNVSNDIEGLQVKVYYGVEFQWRWWNRLWRPFSENYASCGEPFWQPIRYVTLGEAKKAAAQLKGKVYSYRTVVYLYFYL